MIDNENELEIVILPQVQESMDADPELAEMMRGFFANVRQANEAVNSGRYSSFEDAMEAITGRRPEAVEWDDEDETP